MKIKFFLLIILSINVLPALGVTELPSKFIDLLPYVQPAPDQGRTGTCIYVGSTGAMEIIANKKYGIKNPKSYGRYDLSEGFLINAPAIPEEEAEDKIFLEKQVLKFNVGFGILAKVWDFDVWNGSRPDRTVWDNRDYSQMPKVPLPKIETIFLFKEGKDRWATNVLDDSHIDMIKEALVTHQSPVLITYNDSGFWHVINIVGYDDRVPGKCYETPQEECDDDVGSFYVRDSFGLSVEVRDYDWFRIKGNTAVVVKEANE